MKDIKNKLLNYGRSLISKEDIASLFHIEDDESLFYFLEDNKELLVPVKNAKTNGNRRFPIFTKYRIMVRKESNDELEGEVKQLHPILLKNGWLEAHVGSYEKYKDVIDRLNKFFFDRHTEKEYLSRKERSFDLFCEEKKLDDSGVKSLLKSLNISKDDLKFYDTPEYSFNDFIPEKRERMTLLICENKDIWYNLRRLMYEKHCTKFFGIGIDGVVYGNGNNVSTKLGLTEYLSFMNMDDNTQLLYWGDIDRAGLDIYIRAKENNPQLNIGLFVPGYKEMIMLSDKKHIPNSEDNHTSRKEFEGIYNLFEPKISSRIQELLEQNKRLPQEIVNFEVLKQNAK